MEDRMKSIKGKLRQLGLLSKPPPMRVIPGRKQRKSECRPKGRQIMQDRFKDE